MENILDEAAIQKNADREKLKSLLAFKPKAVQNTIMNLFDTTHNLLEPGSDVVSVLGQSNIKSRRELSAALEKAGVRPLSNEFNNYYDRYCAEYPDLSI